MADQFHISLSTAATVAVSTAFIYVAFIVLVRVTGPRSLSNLLVSNGALLVENLRKARVAENDVRQPVRQAGVHSLSEVGCVVLERNGAVSLIKATGPVDPWLLADLAEPRNAARRRAPRDIDHPATQRRWTTLGRHPGYLLHHG